MVSNLSAGTHEVDLFFVDRHTTGSDIQFSITPVPESSSIIGILAFSALSLGGFLQRQQKKQQLYREKKILGSLF